MAEYYAVERSPEYLMHYGVKGMRWGVRKAIERGNDRRLSRHFKRANKKLAKLNDLADISKQKKLSEDYNKAAKTSASIGLTGLGLLAGGAGAYRLSKLLGVKYGERQASALNNAAKSETYAARRLYNNAADHYKELANKQWNINSALRDIHYDSMMPTVAGVTLGSLGSAVGGKILSKKAKNRTTKEGHAKAVANRDAWQREMRLAFKGTKYDFGNSKKRRS